MDKTLFHVTRENVYRATAWIVACGAAWIVTERAGTENHFLFAFALPLAILKFGGPLIAVGALSDRQGAAILLVVLTLIAFVAYAVVFI